MKPLTLPMKTVVRILGNKEDPIQWFLAGQLRLIYAGLERRELIRWVEGNRIPILTPAGRNEATRLYREKS